MSKFDMDNPQISTYFYYSGVEDNPELLSWSVYPNLTSVSPPDLPGQALNKKQVLCSFYDAWESCALSVKLHNL